MTARRSRHLAAGVLSALVVLAATGAHPATAGERDGARSQVTAAPEESGCINYCYKCDNTPSWNIINDGEGPKNTPEPETGGPCFEGDPCAKCDAIAVTEWKDLVAAVERNDIDEFARRANDNPAIRLNTERSAIQLIGCDGATIVGHVTIEPTRLAELVATGSALAN